LGSFLTNNEIVVDVSDLHPPFLEGFSFF